MDTSPLPVPLPVKEHTEPPLTATAPGGREGSVCGPRAGKGAGQPEARPPHWRSVFRGGRDCQLQDVKSPSAVSWESMKKLSHNTHTVTLVKAVEPRVSPQTQDSEQGESHLAFLRTDGIGRTPRPPNRDHFGHIWWGMHSATCPCNSGPLPSDSRSSPAAEPLENFKRVTHDGLTGTDATADTTTQKHTECSGSITHITRAHPLCLPRTLGQGGDRTVRRGVQQAGHTAAAHTQTHI